MTADAKVCLEENSTVLLFFPCPVCGHRVFGNYCSNCGKPVTAISKVDFIRVDLTVAAGILKKALEDIVETICLQGKAEGASEKEIVQRVKERFDVPERVKPKGCR